MVISIGLPLLIVNGKFQSLGSMSVEDLETFIPFLVKCSVHRAGAPIINGVPVWWVSNVQYKFPLQKPHGLSRIGYRRHLSSIVCRCYWYHNAEYLLPFCAEIAQNPDSIFLRKNEDDTTSIFYAQNTIHIMKFNNENKDYDNSQKKEKNYRRCLLPALPKRTTTIPDIYLCENCDAEFSSHTDMQKHEKECYEIIIDDEKCRTKSGSPKEIEVLEHIKPVFNLALEKHNYFNYLMLRPSCSPNVMKKSKLKKSFDPKRWVNVDMCLHKKTDIEFSSDLGRQMLKLCVKRDLMNKIEKSLAINETFCGTGVKASRELREPMDLRVICKRLKKTDWVHQYCFTKRERRNRLKTIMTGLDENSRKLLKQCKNLRVVLTKLKPTS